MAVSVCLHNGHNAGFPSHLSDSFEIMPEGRMIDLDPGTHWKRHLVSMPQGWRGVKSEFHRDEGDEGDV
jgi:hypothetical protein